MTFRGIRRWKSRLEPVVGDAAGDRRAEATGAVEARSGEYPDQPAVDRALYEVREAHGDILPREE